MSIMTSYLTESATEIDGKELKRRCYAKFRQIMRYEKTRNDCVGCASETICWPPLRCPQCRICEKLGQCDDGRGCVFYLEWVATHDDIGDQYGDRDNPALDIKEL